MKCLWACGCLFLAVSLTMAGGGNGNGGKRSKVDFESFFKKLDGNMDGKLSRDEFLKLADRAKDQNQARAKLGQEYDKLDPEKKGVTRDVLRRYLDHGKNGAPPAKSK